MMGEGRNSEWGAMGALEVTDTLDDFSWFGDACPLFGGFGWLVVGWDFDLGDEGGRRRLEDMTYFLVAMFELLSALDAFKDRFVVREFGKC